MRPRTWWSLLGGSSAIGLALSLWALREGVPNAWWWALVVVLALTAVGSALLAWMSAHAEGPTETEAELLREEIDRVETRAEKLERKGR